MGIATLNRILRSVCKTALGASPHPAASALNTVSVCFTLLNARRHLRLEVPRIHSWLILRVRHPDAIKPHSWLHQTEIDQITGYLRVADQQRTLNKLRADQALAQIQLVEAEPGQIREGVQEVFAAVGPTQDSLKVARIVGAPAEWR